MEVTVIEATRNPKTLIGVAAGTCCGRPWPSRNRVRRCIANGHTTRSRHMTTSGASCSR